MGLSACSKSTKTVSVTSNSCSSRVSTTYSLTAEEAVCTTSFAPTSTTTLSGQAYYKARTMNSSAQLTSVSADRAIRFAEIEVTTSSGQIVTCGETLSNGTFSLTVPDNLGPLTVSVKSRSNNTSELRAAVLNCPENNRPYRVTGTFDPAAPAALTLRADVTGEILGAAFNILDQFYEANSFFRSQVGNCGGATSSECTAVTTSFPKVQAYWTKGFNPNSYFGSPNSGVSFYLPGYSRLFILGGIGGDTDTTDTDHFDNSVILHEYGHFLEDIQSNTDSPGGAHSGNKPIDPRLAWSEGFGNFIQAAITNNPYYQDSYGNSAGTAGSFFNIPLEAPAGGCTVGSTATGCDIPAVAGEGNFREFSIARLLWDVFDSTGESSQDLVNNAFLELWKSMTSLTGLKNPNEQFRSIGFIHHYQDSILPTDWASLRTLHSHGKTEEYAHYVASNMSGCTYTMTPFNDSAESYQSKNQFDNSNLLRNNDFLFYKHSGGSLNLSLSYTTNSGNESDLDLYLLDSDARLAVTTDIVRSSNGYFDRNTATQETESVSGSLPAGDYLIRIFVYTGLNQSGAAIGSISNGSYIPAGGPLTYRIQANGVDLCPTTRP